MLYDFLIGGMLSAALVPILSDYARFDRNRTDTAEVAASPSKEEQVGPNPDLVRLVGALLSLAVVTLAGLTLLMVVFSPQVASLLAGGFDEFDPTLLPLTARLLRLMAPVVWFVSMAGLLTAVLFALQRFSMPALASAVYNLGIVVAAPLLAGRIGIASLAVGVLAGSMVQFGLMAWDVRTGGIKVYRAVESSGISANRTALSAYRGRASRSAVPGRAGSPPCQRHRCTKHRMDEQSHHSPTIAPGDDKCCHLVGGAAPAQPAVCGGRRRSVPRDAGTWASHGVGDDSADPGWPGAAGGADRTTFF